MNTDKKPTDFAQLFAESNAKHYGFAGRVKRKLGVAVRHPIIYGSFLGFWVLAMTFAVSVVLRS